MKTGLELKIIKPEEATWLESLKFPFAAFHISDALASSTECLEVFMLDKTVIHKQFNPNGCIKFYLQKNSNSMPDYSKPVFLPTGTFSVDHGMQIMRCADGFLHDASGFPALSTGLFGDEYFLHGKNYTPIEYFRYLEKKRGQYKEYQPRKYVEFIANVLGEKNKD